MNNLDTPYYENIVYISHPYGGNADENYKRVTFIIQELQKRFPDYLFISPIHAFSCLYHQVEYWDGLQKCLWLLNQCDEMWVFGDYKKSTGCMAEIAYCINHHIRYITFNNEDIDNLALYVEKVAKIKEVLFGYEQCFKP